MAESHSGMQSSTEQTLASSTTDDAVKKNESGLIESSEDGDGDAVDAGDYPRGFKLLIIVLALLLTMFLVALDLTIVATAIPRIADDFKSFADIGWYASAFFITLGVFQSPWGKAFKHFNLKWTFLSSVFVFEVGSLICGVSQNSNTLIVGRAIAGLGGAGILSGVYIITAFLVPPPKVPKYIGLVGAVFAVASVAGPLLGGVFTESVTWRWIFYINLPIGGLSLAIVTIFYRTPAAVKPVPIALGKLAVAMDPLGIALSLGFLICFTLATQHGGLTKSWSSPYVAGTLSGFVIMVILFGVDQWLWRENALLVTRILKQRTIAGVSAFIFSLNACNLMLTYNLPLYFQIIKGLSATDSGIRNLPLILGSASLTALSGWALGRVGYYQLFLALGGALITLGAGLVYTLDINSGLGPILGYQLIVGFGVGASIQVPVTVAQAFSEPADIAVVTAMVLFFQLISGSIWVAASQALLGNRLVAVLGEIAPHLDPLEVLAVGATEIRHVFQGADLDSVLKAYMVGLKDSWLMATVVGAITFLLAFAGQWKSLKGSRIVAMAA